MNNEHEEYLSIEDLRSLISNNSSEDNYDEEEEYYYPMEGFELPSASEFREFNDFNSIMDKIMEIIEKELLHHSTIFIENLEELYSRGRKKLTQDDIRIDQDFIHDIRFSIENEIMFQYLNETSDSYIEFNNELEFSKYVFNRLDMRLSIETTKKTKEGTDKTRAFEQSLSGLAEKRKKMNF